MDGVDDLFAPAAGVVALDGVQQQDELVAAEPDDEVGGPAVLGEHGDDAAQDVVPDRVAEHVVDALEVVQVDHEDGDVVLLGVASQPGEVPGVRVPVRGAGELVEVDPLREAGVLEPDPLRLQAGPGGPEELDPGPPPQRGQDVDVAVRGLGGAEPGGDAEGHHPDRRKVLVTEPGEGLLDEVRRGVRPAGRERPDRAAEPGAPEVAGPR